MFIKQKTAVWMFRKRTEKCPFRKMLQALVILKKKEKKLFK